VENLQLISYERKFAESVLDFAAIAQMLGLEGYNSTTHLRAFNESVK
jgi:hypothetical protein